LPRDHPRRGPFIGPVGHRNLVTPTLTPLLS